MNKVLALFMIVCCAQAQFVWDQIQEATLIVEGILQGMGDSDFKEIQNCMTNGDEIYATLSQAITAMQTGDITGTVNNLSTIFEDLPGMLSKCQNVQQDIAKLNQLNGLFTNPLELWMAISSNALTKGPEMITRMMTASNDFSAGNYRAFGSEMSSSIFWFFGL